MRSRGRVSLAGLWIPAGRQPASTSSWLGGSVASGAAAVSPVVRLVTSLEAVEPGRLSGARVAAVEVGRRGETQTRGRQTGSAKQVGGRQFYKWGAWAACGNWQPGRRLSRAARSLWKVPPWWPPSQSGEAASLSPCHYFPPQAGPYIPREPALPPASSRAPTSSLRGQLFFFSLPLTPTNSKLRLDHRFLVSNNPAATPPTPPVNVR